MTTHGATLRCDDERRRDEAVAAGLNGIDFVEVATADQQTLHVEFLAPLPGESGGPATPALTSDNVRIEGGVRVVGVRIDSVTASGSRLVVVVDRAGDFSPYIVRIAAAPGTDQPPAGFDPALSTHEFSFKAACPSPYDCEPPPAPGVPAPPSPVIDYLARDFQGFVRLLTDRLSLTNPSWADRSPADPHIALVELLADLGDRLSYEQDAVGTEAYLGTARSRVSLRRHARLLDHVVDDGSNASTWVHLDVTPSGVLDGTVLEAGALVLSGAGGGPAGVLPEALDDELRAGSLVFQTTTSVVPTRQRNRIRIHTWSDADCTLLAGATEITLVRAPGLALAAGDLVLLEEERSPVSGSAADADPARRHVVALTDVRTGADPVTGTPLIVAAWSATQALPFDLVVSSRVEGAGAPVETSVARANLVRVDHGYLGVLDEPIVVPEWTDRPFRPRLDVADLAIVSTEGVELPAVELDDGAGTWEWRPAVDLLGASADDPLFVVEFEHGHRPRLRFGDGRFGRRPAPGTILQVRARRGTGPAGNVGADALSRLLTPTPDAIRLVRNPLPARGGRAPESRDRIITDAPATLRRQERAVTAADWVEMAERHPAVQRAYARLRWTGSWWTVFVAVDRVGGGGVLADPELAASLRTHLDRYRMAGTDLELIDPVFVALDLHVEITVERGHYRSDVARAVHDALSPGPHADGSTGIFHPDRLTFGQDLYLSRIHEAIDGIAGVRCADIVACHPLGSAPAGELTGGVVRIAAGEVLRLDDDPNRPEHGRLRIDARGGV
jgi:hypothetical protein